MNEEQTTFCRSLKCDDWPVRKVCGIREESEGYRLKLFENECRLLEYGCRVDLDNAYGIINLEYCRKAFSNESFPNLSNPENEINLEGIEISDTANNCMHINCTLVNNEENICAIKRHGDGYKIGLFTNRCELLIHNCEENDTFAETDSFICKDIFSNMTHESDKKLNTAKAGRETSVDDAIDNLVIVDTDMLGSENVNESIETFFAATHVLDLPMREVNPDLVSDITRRRLIKVMGPVKVFQPWTTIPSNITDDYMHSPTLSSCYHKCPTKCPDTYAPVCGVPGIVAREPSLMFKNHCFMDVAQCKMRWEDKSPTAISSSYIESSFMFCLGDQLNAMYRFLPLVRTLQHMGRLKKRGRFKYRLRNMKFFNSLLTRDPNLMG